MYDDIAEKSLLTSLCQREAISPSLAKRGDFTIYADLLMTALIIALLLPKL